MVCFLLVKISAAGGNIRIITVLSFRFEEGRLLALNLSWKL